MNQLGQGMQIGGYALSQHQNQINAQAAVAPKQPTLMERLTSEGATLSDVESTLENILLAIRGPQPTPVSTDVKDSGPGAPVNADHVIGSNHRRILTISDLAREIARRIG